MSAEQSKPIQSTPPNSPIPNDFIQKVTAMTSTPSEYQIILQKLTEEIDTDDFYNSLTDLELGYLSAEVYRQYDGRYCEIMDKLEAAEKQVQILSTEVQRLREKLVNHGFSLRSLTL